MAEPTSLGYFSLACTSREIVHGARTSVNSKLKLDVMRADVDTSGVLA